MDLSLLGLWLVCGLGSAVFAALAPAKPLGVIAFAVGFTLAVLWARLPFSSPAVVEVAAAAIATWSLVRGTKPVYALATAGVLAGCWTEALNAQGLPWWGSVLAAPIVPAVSARLAATRPSFTTPQLREEALLFVLVVGLVAAAAPGLIAGWHAATNLRIQGTPATASTIAIPIWTITVTSVALLSGGAYSLWSRR